MKGPCKIDEIITVTPPSPDSWEVRHGLTRNVRYRVKKDFFDSDKNIHAAGEEWIFVAGMYSKFDGDMTICIRLDDESEWKISLNWDNPMQGEIIENIENYIETAVNY